MNTISDRRRHLLWHDCNQLSDNSRFLRERSAQSHEWIVASHWIESRRARRNVHSWMDWQSRSSSDVGLESIGWSIVEPFSLRSQVTNYCHSLRKYRITPVSILLHFSTWQIDSKRMITPTGQVLQCTWKTFIDDEWTFIADRNNYRSFPRFSRKTSSREEEEYGNYPRLLHEPKRSDPKDAKWRWIQLSSGELPDHDSWTSCRFERALWADRRCSLELWVLLVCYSIWHQLWHEWEYHHRDRPWRKHRLHQAYPCHGFLHGRTWNSEEPQPSHRRKSQPRPAWRNLIVLTSFFSFDVNLFWKEEQREGDSW